MLERRSSAHNPVLEVVLDRGKPKLDAATVNYSFGELHDVLRSAFLQMEIPDGSLSRVLMLGFGAGSAMQLLDRKLAINGSARAVEVDPVVIELARKYFERASDPRLEIVNDDALRFIRTDADTYDLILMDIFIDDETPEHVETRECLALAAARLRPGGSLVYNRLANRVRRQAAALQFRDVFMEIFPAARVLTAHGNLVFVHTDRG